MADPDWLILARAEGRVISETSALVALHATPGSRGMNVSVPKQVSGPSSKKAEQPPMGRLSLTVTISPLRLASEANAGGTRRAAIARKSAVKAAVAGAMPAMTFPLPAVVTLTRLGGKSLDGDNLQRAMKAVRDVVAKWLGCDDADKRIRWRYRQRPAWVMGCRIQVRERK